MFGLSFAAKNVVAIIDVGSGSAAVGIMQLREKDTAIISAAHRTPLSFEDREEAQTISSISAAIKEAGQKVLTTYNALKEHPTPGQLFIFLRIPWTRSKTADVKQKFEENVAISDKMISSLAKQALADEKDIDANNLFEATVTRILLNGYRTYD